ncbi:MAG: hypothetical protein R3F41_10030 [Gammaproteobacteria bacterium]|nr:hypothetical protein [Pseudomonadales bacterium]MCP5347942.1 hypothetical protein [Pseudomonadales bacterium]
MPKQLSLLFLAATLLLCGTTAAGAERCDNDGEIRFLCGLTNGEDLVRLPGTQWVIASSMVDEGALYAIDTGSGSISRIFPAAAAGSDQDQIRFGACPGPLSSRFRPHGLAVRAGTGANPTLYAVGHGDREAVEIFDVETSGTLPRLTWRGCVVAPGGVSLNSVTPLPEGGFVATNFNTRGGQLWEWHAALGWNVVPGSEMRGPNGIVASADGRWLFIGGWVDQAVVRLSRGQQPVQKAVVSVGFHVDNVRWAADGTLLAAGQYGAAGASIGRCLNGGNCQGVASRAARVDPETLKVEQLINYPSSQRLVFGTVALQVGNEIWLGGIAGGERIARFYP